MKSIDNVGITFANTVLGRGVFQGVVNITLGCLLWSPTEDGKVDPDVAIVGRLRLTEACAIQLRDALNDQLASIEAQRSTEIAVKEAIKLHGNGSAEESKH